MVQDLRCLFNHVPIPTLAMYSFSFDFMFPSGCLGRVKTPVCKCCVQLWSACCGSRLHSKDLKEDLKLVGNQQYKPASKTVGWNVKGL